MVVHLLRSTRLSYPFFFLLYHHTVTWNGTVVTAYSNGTAIAFTHWPTPSPINSTPSPWIVDFQNPLKLGGITTALLYPTLSYHNID